MKSKNKHAKKDLHLAYSQGNMTAYPPNIKAMDRYLSTKYPNNKSTNQHNGKKGDKEGDEPKSKDNDSNRMTLQVHTLDILQQLKNQLLRRGAIISAHVLETSAQSSHPSPAMEEILGAHPMNDDDCWGGTNPGDVSIDTTNNEKMMTGSHIIESHTHT